MKDKVILFVMPRLPFPSISGRKTCLYNYCKIISENLGYKLIVAAFLEEGDDPNKKPDFIDELIILPEEKKINRIKNIIINSFIKRKLPIQTALYWSNTANEIIKKIIEEKKVDIVIADMIRTTEYIKDAKCYKIADLDDRISLRYKRQLKNDFKNINPYGAFLNKMPNLIKRIMLLSPIKKFVTKNEIYLLNKYELEVGKKFDKTIFVAKKEAEELNKELGEEKAYAVPLGVDVNFFKPEENIKKENMIAFLGALSVAHNETTVINFIENIFPKILQRDNNIKFIIIGGGASDKLLKYKSNNIIFTGRVDDVRDYLKRCKVFVCPMTFGTGIKTKNLEAMAMGLPVVTTSIGAENIEAQNLKDWIVTDEYEDFAYSVLKLMNDEQLNKLIGENANKFINENFTWNITEKHLKNILKRSIV